MNLLTRRVLQYFSKVWTEDGKVYSTIVYFSVNFSPLLGSNVCIYTETTDTTEGLKGVLSDGYSLFVTFI